MAIMFTFAIGAEGIDCIVGELDDVVFEVWGEVKVKGVDEGFPA